MTETRDLFGNEIPDERRYDLGDGKTIGRSSLRDADRETQIEAMKSWFFATYEDPAENMPYVGDEGGYQYIHGGPFNARQELDGEFMDVVSDEIIEEAVEEIERFGTEWAPKVDYNYDEYLLDSFEYITKPYNEFTNVISHTRVLADIDIVWLRQKHLYRLLYVSAIIACETYLSDAFISNVCTNKARLRKFVETHKDFSKERITLGELFSRADTIERDVKKYLLRFPWHQISVVRGMFRNTLNVLFPNDLEFLQNAIRVRHDIVHRGGKKKDDTEHQISKEDIQRVTKAVGDFVWFIEHQLNPEGSRWSDEIDEDIPF